MTTAGTNWVARIITNITRSPRIRKRENEYAAPVAMGIAMATVTSETMVELRSFRPRW